MNKDLTTIKELIAEMKAQFSKSEAFDKATLSDGVTVIEYDSLEVGQMVYVVADGEQIPAPEGTHTLTGDQAGISIIVDAEGKITEVINESVEETATVEETEETFEVIDPAMIPALLESMTEAIAAELNIEMGAAYDIASKILNKVNNTEVEVVEQAMSAKLKSCSKAIEELSAVTISIADSNNNLLKELQKLQSEFKAYKELPVVNTKENNRLPVGSELTARQQFLKNNKN
jgi:hypothetical protein